MRYLLLDAQITPQDHSIVAGSSANITCSPTILSPSTTYQWLHNDTIIENEASSILNLSNVKETDSGVYRCIVKINGTTAASDDALVYLVYKPAPGKSNIINEISTLSILCQILIISVVRAWQVSSLVELVSY